LTLATAGALVGTGVAGNLIKIFEPERVVGVPLNLSSLGSLPDLAAYGTVSVVKEPAGTDVGSREAAAAASGLRLLAPETMAGVKGDPVFTVISAGSGSFTFDLARAKAATGGSDLPASLDGTTLFVTGGPAVIETVGGPSHTGSDIAPDTGTEAAGVTGREKIDVAAILGRLPDLVIVQMKAPVVSSDGPSVHDYEEALLGLPGIPADLAAQIRALGDPSSTLPVPIPVELAASHSVDVNGVKALAIGDNTGVGSGVVWQANGMVYAVGGTLTENQVLEIARSMH
jgi:hypothetical protein